VVGGACGYLSFRIGRGEDPMAGEALGGDLVDWQR
jgi:hypothetical protein